LVLERQIEWHCIAAGKRIQNAFIESFNGTLRAECLNTRWFTGLSGACETLEAWRREDNELRQHSAIENTTSLALPYAPGIMNPLRTKRVENFAAGRSDFG